MRHNFIRSEFLLCTFSEKNGNAIFVFLRKPVSRRIASVFNFVLTLICFKNLDIQAQRSLIAFTFE